MSIFGLVRNVVKSVVTDTCSSTACHKDSIFTTSSGGVRTGTIKGKAEFITASPNVMIEGVPAVRQGDLMTSNNRNTPPMPLMQPGAGKPPEVAMEGPGQALEAAEQPERTDWATVGEEAMLEKGLGGEHEDE